MGIHRNVQNSLDFDAPISLRSPAKPPEPDQESLVIAVEIQVKSCSTIPNLLSQAQTVSMRVFDPVSAQMHFNSGINDLTEQTSASHWKRMVGNTLEKSRQIWLLWQESEKQCKMKVG